MFKFNYLMLVLFHLLAVFNVSAENGVDAYELIYEEQERGTDPYRVKLVVSDRFLRIDTIADQSGYIVYDDKAHVIFSVAHHERSILVINKHGYQKPDFNKQVEIEYYAIPDAPQIAGKTIHSYRVAASGEAGEKCLDIKLAENLLPEVSQLLMAYQKMLAGQQSLLLNVTPEEYRTTCFLYDQVFNEGDYYQKGLPIQEWHSNGKTRLLVSYKKVKVDPEIFKTEESYQKYSLE